MISVPYRGTMKLRYETQARTMTDRAMGEVIAFRANARLIAEAEALAASEGSAGAMLPAGRCCETSTVQGT